MVSCLHVNAHPPLPTLSFAVPGVPSDTFTPSWTEIWLRSKSCLGKTALAT